MFVYDNDLGNSYRIEEKDIIVGMINVDVIVGIVNVIEWPQLQVKITVYKAYIDDIDVLYKYRRDFIELLQYETGVYMPVKSESFRDNLDYVQMDLEFHYPY
jgi:hypothetical protein